MLNLIFIGIGGAIGAVLRYQEKLDTLLPFLDEVVEEGLITLEKVRVIKYRHKS